MTEDIPLMEGSQQAEEAVSAARVPSIQWFPGHMAKTRRLMEENLKLVDAVVEVLDARIPYSSRNPEIQRIVGDKPKIVALNRADIADPEVTRRWADYFTSKGCRVVITDCRSGQGVNGVLTAARGVLAEMLKRRADKGAINYSVRLMIVGVPNVGKSSLINRLAGSKKAKVEDRPGVTRSKQWVPLSKDAELLDMPGVLWPKFEDPEVGEKLAFTGAVKDNVMDLEALAARLLLKLREIAPLIISDTLKLKLSGNEEGWEMLESLGRRRGMLVSGGEVDTERAAIRLLDEFRGGKLGRITLEVPEALKI